MNWKQDFLLVADALGRTEQAQAYLDAFHRTAERFGQELTTAPTVSLVRTTSDRTRIFGVPSFAGSIAQDAGLGPSCVAAIRYDLRRTLAAEQIAAVDADWIFYGVQAGADAGVQPAVADLDCGVADRVMDVDDDSWYLNAGPTAASAVLDQVMSTTTGA